MFRRFGNKGELDNFVWEHMDENSKRAILGLPIENKIYSNITDGRIEDKTDKDEKSENTAQSDDGSKNNPQAPIPHDDGRP
jgi:hypothetical protein